MRADDGRHGRVFSIRLNDAAREGLERAALIHVEKSGGFNYPGRRGDLGRFILGAAMEKARLVLQAHDAENEKKLGVDAGSTQRRRRVGPGSTPRSPRTTEKKRAARRGR